MYMILTYLSGPVIGALIGYCTNYIAVKMLFYPKKEIRICSRKLPFTPGAIPKEQPRLAKAIGQIVTRSLLTTEDIKNMLLKEETQKAMIDKGNWILNTSIKQNICLLTEMDESSYQKEKGKIINLVCDAIMQEIAGMKVGDIIAKESAGILKEKTKGTMLEMFVSDRMIHSLIEPIGTGVQEYIEKNGSSYVLPVLQSKLETLEKESASEILTSLGYDENMQTDWIRNCYRSIIQEGISSLLEKMDMAKMIEDKINAMDIDQLEMLVLQVMKKELDMIVNLGALIGFLLGMINIIL